MLVLLAFFTNEPIANAPTQDPRYPDAPSTRIEGFKAYEPSSDQKLLHELLLQAPSPDLFVVEDERHQLVSQLDRIGIEYRLAYTPKRYLGYEQIAEPMCMKLLSHDSHCALPHSIKPTLLQEECKNLPRLYEKFSVYFISSLFQ